MSAIDQVIGFARDYINRPSARTPQRKALIREALLVKTGKKLGNNCGTCYIEAIFKILNLIKMANYELRKGYVAQFPGTGFNGVKAFTNVNLKTDPAKYDPIAAEYLRLYPERAIYFVRIPKAPVKKEIVKPVIKEVIQKAEVKPPESVIEDVLEAVQQRKPKRVSRKPKNLD